MRNPAFPGEARVVYRTRPRGGLALRALCRQNQPMRALASLLVAALLVGGIYYVYVRRMPAAAPGTAPTQAISLTGVKSDLLAIGQAERLFIIQSGHCGSLEELVSSGALAFSRPGRDGYDYAVECSGADFTITARHPAPPPAGVTGVRYPTMTLDQTMEFHESD
jgi:hypothetical protein